MSEPPIHGTAARGFDAAADVYERARPTYPDAAVDWLVEALALVPSARVVDLAAGTGKLTRALVARGIDVVGVEPVEGMRARFRDVLPDVPVLDGTAEAMPLEEGSVDAVTVAQAFHWFRLPDALGEIHRVLAPRRRLGLIWNARDERVDWMRRLTEMIDPYEGDDIKIHRHRRGHWRAPLWSSPLFSFVAEHEVTHAQKMDVPALIERIESTSFVAILEPDRRAALLDAIRALAGSHPDLAGRARFDFPYVCEAYVFERR